MDHEVPVLVVRPIDMGEEPVPGSDTIQASCGHVCWIAPSSLAALKAGPMDVFCLRCAPGGFQEVRILPGVPEELVARFGEDHAAEALAEFEEFARRLKANRQN